MPIPLSAISPCDNGPALNLTLLLAIPHIKILEAMSKTGVCKFFNGDLGFGFIEQDDGGEDIFVHRNQCSDGQNPNEGDALTYDVAWDDRKGKNNAANVKNWTFSRCSPMPMLPDALQMPDADAARCQQQIAEADAACRCDCGGMQREGQGQGQGQGGGEGEDAMGLMSCCECKCCGILGQGCTVQCSELVRICVAGKRGKDCSILMQRLHGSVARSVAKENPKFCGCCRDHGLLDLRLKAVQRMRKRKRSLENDEHQPMAKRM